MTATHTPAVLLGSAIGDALGMPFEKLGIAKHADLAYWSGNFVEGTYHKLPAGHWTDDTEMAVALAQALIEKQGFDGQAVADNYLKWFDGNPTGIGGTVKWAMESYKRMQATGYTVSGDWRDCGKKYHGDELEEVGAGTVMRVAPLGVFYANQPEMLRWSTKLDAYITHKHPEAFAASLAVASLIAGIIRHPVRGGDYKSARHHAIDFMMDQLIVVKDSTTARVLQRSTPECFNWSPEEMADQVSGRFGNAWQIATTAIHCALHYWHNFEKAVTSAVRLGGDTDTRAAVTGAIMGAMHGRDGIPTGYILGVKDAEMLIALDSKLWHAANAL